MDTIAAISTGNVLSGIGIIRISAAALKRTTADPALLGGLICILL